jgi:hypothetical protein
MRTIRLAAALTLLVAACHDGAGTVAPGASATRTLITDGPFPFSRVARVDLYVVSVSASVSPDTSAGAGSFVTLATPGRRVNLLALQNGITDELGAVKVPAGAIRAVRMVIDTDSSSITLKSGQVLTGKSTPGIQWQSSAGRPTLNAVIHEQILVPDSGAVVVIDYDVGQAFIPPQEINPASTDSGFIFSPVLRAADARRTGTITGTVRARTGSGAPVVDAALRLYLGNPGTNENTWSVIQTGKTAADGTFRISYVTQSAYWATFPAHAGKTYIVAIDPPPGSGLARVLVPNLGVTAGADTPAGTVVLP